MKNYALLFFLALSVLTHAKTQAFAGDIRPRSNFGFESSETIISAVNKLESWNLGLGSEYAPSVELFERDPKVHSAYLDGFLSTSGPLSMHTDFSFRISSHREYVNRLLSEAYSWQEGERIGARLEAAWRQIVPIKNHWKIAIIPSVELGINEPQATSLPDKTKLGILLASTLHYRAFEWSQNFGYRYRPIELFGPYRLSSDFLIGSRFTYRNSGRSFSLETSQRTIYALDTIKIKPSYQSQQSEFFKIIYGQELNENLIAQAFFSQPFSSKNLGVASHQYGISIRWQFAPINPVYNPLPMIEPDKETAPARPPQPVAPIPPDSVEDDPNELSLLAYNFESKIDRIQHRLYQMEFAETDQASSARERAILEAQIAEVLLRRLEQTEIGIRQKESLEKIRKDIQKRLTQD